MKLELIQVALAKSGIQVDSMARINNCCTNIHLGGGGIFSIYDSGRFLLQGKPTPAEASLYATLVRQSQSKAAVVPKNEFQEWEDWLAANYSERPT